jgi:hypothetical protein
MIVKNVTETSMRSGLLMLAMILSASGASAAEAPFGCAAMSGTCNFRIYLEGGRSRDVVLPAGMKVSVPDVRIGSDSYCMVVNKKPVNTCPRKVISENYNN